MKPVWLLGHPDEPGAACSPAILNAGLEARGEQPVFAFRSCMRDELETVLADAESRCRGLSVTAPFQVRVAARYAAVLDDDARAAGSVSTVVFDERGDRAGEPHGDAVVAMNTDVGALVRSWRRASFHVEGRTLAIIGAGGAARAVAVAAHHAKAAAIVVHARGLAAAREIVEVAARLGLDATAASVDGSEPLGATFAVVASSGIDDPGAWLDRALAGPGAVHDLRHGARSRPLRDAALARGHLFADGTLLLLERARLALAAFVGGPVSDEATTAMRRALTSSLG